MLEKGKFPTVDGIEKAYANPVKYDFDHCLKQYTQKLNQIQFEQEDFERNENSILGFNFFSKDKILPMPGINYDKIKVYREAKRHKKFTSMTNIPDVNHLKASPSEDEYAKTQGDKKRRFRSI